MRFLGGTGVDFSERTALLDLNVDSIEDLIETGGVRVPFDTEGNNYDLNLPYLPRR